MAGISVSGLISNSFDWKSVVDQLIAIDTAPVTRLQNEESKNNDRLTSLSSLKSDFTDLQTALDALKADGLFNGRAATSSTSGSTWKPAASAGAATGSYLVAVSQLATAAVRTGADIGGRLSATSDVSGLTLATLRTAKAVTAGTFTVNNAQITVATTDSLQDVFDRIASATGNTVTAAYDPGADKVTLTASSGEVLLGSTTDTSNFLSALGLANNGTGTTTSANRLGTVSPSATLAASGLSTPASGSGTFTVNGVAIAYDASSDTLNSLLSRINASAAGVTAAYDSANDRVTLANNATGDTGMALVDSAGGILASLGLTTGSGATFTRGLNTQFTVNGGATRTSKSNALDADTLGVTGLSLTVDSTGTQAIAVNPDTAAMKTAINTFITKFNALQKDIDTATKITKGANNKVTAAILADNREVQSWSSSLRTLAFGSVSGLSGTMKRLENLGIDFSSTDSSLSIKDDAKLTAALTNSGADVGAFFTTANTGFVAKMGAYVDHVLDATGGTLKTQTETLNRQNTSIEAQIAVLNHRLEDERTRLTTAFLAMQNAQSTAQTQQATIKNMFSSSSSNN